jgi:hypothetical protein
MDRSASEVCAGLRSQTMRIPDLRPAFAGWLQGVNPLYSELVPAVDARLETLISDPKILAKAKAGNISLFASTHVLNRLP